MFTVVSLLLSTMLIVCYSMAVHTAFTGEEIGSFRWYSYNSFPNQNMLRVKIFTILVLILGCLEFLLCVVSIGYFAYSYRRDYGKVSAESWLSNLWQKYRHQSQMFITLEVYILFYNTPSRIRRSRLFARLRFCKRFIRYFGDAEKKIKLFLRPWPLSLLTCSLSIWIFFCINTSININTYLMCFDHSLLEFGNFLYFQIHLQVINFLEPR